MCVRACVCVCVERRGSWTFFSLSIGVFLGDDVNDSGAGWPPNSSFFSRIAHDAIAQGYASRFLQRAGTFSNSAPAARIGGATGTCKQRAVAQR